MRFLCSIEVYVISGLVISKGNLYPPRSRTGIIIMIMRKMPSHIDTKLNQNVEVLINRTADTKKVNMQDHSSKHAQDLLKRGYFLLHAV